MLRETAESKEKTMECFNIIIMAGAIGSVITAILAIIGVIKIAQKAMFKTEKLYGQEAVDRYEALLAKVPERAPNAFLPTEYKGGNKATPQFEVERFYFDKNTMPKEWKRFTKTIRYFFEENGKIMVRGWRL